jgi:hypothetical protein
MDGIKVLVEGVRVSSFTSKKNGQDYFTFDVVEPVTKFISYSNNSEKGQLADLAQSGGFVDLQLVLKCDRLYFHSFNAQ